MMVKNNPHYLNNPNCLNDKMLCISKFAEYHDLKERTLLVFYVLDKLPIKQLMLSSFSYLYRIGLNYVVQFNC